MEPADESQETPTDLYQYLSYIRFIGEHTISILVLQAIVYSFAEIAQYNYENMTSRRQ